MTDSAPAPCACAVIGGGPAGLIAALALAHYGVPTLLVARRPDRTDNRTTALLASSVLPKDAIARCLMGAVIGSPSFIFSQWVQRILSGT